MRPLQPKKKKKKAPEVNGLGGKEHQNSQFLCPVLPAPPPLPVSQEHPRKGSLCHWMPPAPAITILCPFLGAASLSWLLIEKQKNNTMLCSKTWVSCCHRTTLRGNHLLQADAWPLSSPSHPCSSPGTRGGAGRSSALGEEQLFSGHCLVQVELVAKEVDLGRCHT